MSLDDKKFQTKREEYVGIVKQELKFFHFGLPHNLKLIEQTHDVTLDDVAKQYKPLKELLVRLNVYIAKGNHQEGSIMFPDANRIIDYRFSASDIKDCYVRFRSMRHISNKILQNIK